MIVFIRDHTFLTSKIRGGEVVLKFVMCLRILLFLNNSTIVHFCRWGWVGGSHNWSFFCGYHKCMAPNVILVFFDYIWGNFKEAIFEKNDCQTLRVVSLLQALFLNFCDLVILTELRPCNFARQIFMDLPKNREFWIC